LKKLIEDFIKQNESILDFLNTTGRDYENADNIVLLFKDTLLQNKFNAALGLDFANILELLNKKEIIEQYALSDISRLFASLIKLQDYNLDTYVDAANFEWAVMDDAEKGKAIATEGIKKAKQKIEELEQLLDDIRKE
jgi:hypothetical protein